MTKTGLTKNNDISKERTMDASEFAPTVLAFDKGSTFNSRTHSSSFDTIGASMEGFVNSDIFDNRFIIEDFSANEFAFQHIDEMHVGLNSSALKEDLSISHFDTFDSNLEEPVYSLHQSESTGNQLTRD